MRTMWNIWLAVWLAVCCAVLPAGCHKDDGPSLGERNVSVLMSVGSRVGEETVAPTVDEAKIHTLRVYAFVGGEPAGYYYTDQPVVSPNRFLMDLKMFSLTTQMVDFYVVANEGAMGALRLDGNRFSFTENTSEAELNRVRFFSLVAGKGLPMFSKQSVKLEMNRDKALVQEPGEHQGHTQLQQTVNFSLQRPVAKLGVYAAKVEGEVAGLNVRAVRLLASGVRSGNYLMPQKPETLQGIGTATEDMILTIPFGGVVVDKTIASDALEKDRRNPDFYTNLLSESCYLFENPDGNGGSWNAPGSGKGSVLEIDYDFGGELQTGRVYMPALQRNHCYNILCLMNNSGVVTVAYTVADWSQDTDSKWEFDFAYPTYDAPVKPVTGENYDAEMYVYAGDDEKGAFCMKFSITAPADVEWTPILPGATEGSHEVRVYRQGADGQPELQRVPYGATTPENPFIIKVIPKDVAYDGKTMKFGITYRPKWLGDAEPQFLLVNSGRKWPGDNEEVINIRQIQTPIN